MSKYPRDSMADGEVLRRVEESLRLMVASPMSRSLTAWRVWHACVELTCGFRKGVDAVHVTRVAEVAKVRKDKPSSILEGFNALRIFGWEKERGTRKLGILTLLPVGHAPVSHLGAEGHGPVSHLVAHGTPASVPTEVDEFREIEFAEGTLRSVPGSSDLNPLEEDLWCPLCGGSVHDGDCSTVNESANPSRQDEIESRFDRGSPSEADKERKLR